MSTATAPAHPAAYRELVDHASEINLLRTSEQLLEWDQDTMMPPGGMQFRARQLAALAGIVHERFTSRKIGDLLAACEADAGLMADALSAEATNVRELRRQYDRQTRLPAELVHAFTETTATARARWAEARSSNDFSLFAPWLDKIVDLNRRRAECFGHASDGEPWDALAEGFEPGCTAAYVRGVFEPLRGRLVELVARIGASKRLPADVLHGVKLPVERQVGFVREVAEAIGFDFSRGRLDVSAHPFCSGTHCNDVRLTTRFREDACLDALGSTLHEAGHGLYEQGLCPEQIGLPAGESVSLSIHESQSRLWENMVGRSAWFWTWLTDRFNTAFGPWSGTLTAEQLYAASNQVKPSLIRVEADEVTYNLHIMIRFELERLFLKGDLRAADLPGEWNRRYHEYLGVEVPDDARGCLQDIHWSMGAMGYFPTYTLGTMYAAQFFDAARRAMPDLPEQIARGEFGHLLEWLREAIHRRGRRLLAEPLCKVVTGEGLSAEPLLRHLEQKFVPLYGL